MSRIMTIAPNTAMRLRRNRWSTSPQSPCFLGRAFLRFNCRHLLAFFQLLVLGFDARVDVAVEDVHAEVDEAEGGSP